MKRILALAPLILLAIIVLVSVVLLTRGGVRETVSAGDLGRPAPVYSLARLGGGAPVSNAGTQGRAHLINIFASWCTPCRAEHPFLMQLKQRGVEIVGVASKDEPEAAARFLAELGDPFSAVALDVDGRFALDLGAAGVPETFVIGPDGAIVAVHRGPLTPDIIAQEILPALQER
jgi:cytochrome c biogenesis protein CcmG/thiol:disulfide interchange protein DsbE